MRHSISVARDSTACFFFFFFGHLGAIDRTIRPDRQRGIAPPGREACVTTANDAAGVLVTSIYTAPFTESPRIPFHLLRARARGSTRRRERNLVRLRKVLITPRMHVSRRRAHPSRKKKSKLRSIARRGGGSGKKAPVGCEPRFAIATRDSLDFIESYRVHIYIYINMHATVDASAST